MALHFTNGTNFTVGGTTTVATLANSGLYTIPNRPYFWTSQTGTGTAIGADIVFNSVGVNQGNHYNSTNGRFTAPVGGRYHFTYRQLSQNANAAGEYVFILYLNGTGALYPTFTQKRAANVWHSNSYSTIVSLSANDYVALRFYSGPSGATTYTDPNYVQFSGHLIG